MLAGTFLEVRGVVLQSSHAGRERETVTDPGTEVNMTATLAARETWCAAVTTAGSLEDFTTREMTAVRSPANKTQSWSIPLCRTLH